MTPAGVARRTHYGRALSSSLGGDTASVRTREAGAEAPTESYETGGMGRRMDLPELPPDDSDLTDYVQRIEERARQQAPATVQGSSIGTLVGAAVFGPAGGVVGAVVGSGIGYLDDEGYLNGGADGDDVDVDATDGDDVDVDATDGDDVEGDSSSDDTDGDDADDADEAGG